MLKKATYYIFTTLTFLFVIWTIVIQSLPIIGRIQFIVKYPSNLPPHFIHDIINLTLVILFVAIFICFTVYLFNLFKKGIEYYNDSKWNKLILGLLVIVTLMFIHTFFSDIGGSQYKFFITQSYLCPTIFLLLYHRFNLRYLDK